LLVVLLLGALVFFFANTCFYVLTLVAQFGLNNYLVNWVLPFGAVLAFAGFSLFMVIYWLFLLGLVVIQLNLNSGNKVARHRILLNHIVSNPLHQVLNTNNHASR
jgi:hypothetical protein